MNTRTVAAVGLAGMVALWFAMMGADVGHERQHQKPPTPIARPIDAGPKIIRTIKIDPCEVAKTFLEAWRCRAM